MSGSETPEVLPAEVETSESHADTESISTTSSKTYSRRARLRARANEMASKISAGRAKVNELLWNKQHAKDGSPAGGPVELAVEADHVSDISDEDVRLLLTKKIFRLILTYLLPLHHRLD